MKFSQTALSGCVVIDLQRHEDERGFFARSFCEEEFESQGLHVSYPQCNVSFNKAKGTFRGMHFQKSPHAEVKVVRCTRGAIRDIVVDLRKDSPTFLRSYSVELTEENGLALYIPEGFAHGFQTLADNTEVLYYMGVPYVPEAASGIRWDDAMLDIELPLGITSISEKDLLYPDIDLEVFSA